MYLHIEGMDLAGKSTVSNLIAQKSRLDWKIYNNCLSSSNPIQDLIKELGGKNLYDNEVYGYLHFVALLADIKDFKLGENIIQDSTILLRSINYHMAEGNYDLVALFKKLAERHPVPDISIYLTASVEARSSRLAERINTCPEKVARSDQLILNDPRKFMELDAYLMELSKHYFNSVVLDTSAATAEETADYIIDLCKI